MARNDREGWSEVTHTSGAAALDREWMERLHAQASGPNIAPGAKGAEEFLKGMQSEPWSFRPLRSIGQAVQTRRIRRQEAVSARRAVMAPAGSMAVSRATKPRVSFSFPEVHLPKSKAGRWTAGVAAGLLVLETLDMFGHDTSTGHDSCSDATHSRLTVGGKGLRGEVHRLFGDDDNNNWSAAAGILSSRYTISPDSLRRLNPSIINYDSKGGMTDRINPGEYCFTLPAPIIGGQEMADGSSDMADVAAQNRLSVSVLIAHNPSLKATPSFVPVSGTVLDVSSSANPRNPHLIERRSPYADLNHVPGLTPAEYLAVLGANAYKAGSGDVHKGTDLFLPLPTGTVTHQVTYPQILDAYHLEK